MFFNLLAEAVDPSLFNKKISLGEAAINALLGFLIVFAGIAILVFIVWAVGKLMQFSSGKKSADSKTAKVKTQKSPAKAKDAAQEELAATAAHTAAQPMAHTAAQEAISEETVAVISAAIAAIYSGSGRTCGFVVKRIKRM